VQDALKRAESAGVSAASPLTTVWTLPAGSAAMEGAVPRVLKTAASSPALSHASPQPVPVAAPGPRGIDKSAGGGVGGLAAPATVLRKAASFAVSPTTASAVPLSMRGGSPGAGDGGPARGKATPPPSGRVVTKSPSTAGSPSPATAAVAGAAFSVPTESFGGGYGGRGDARVSSGFSPAWTTKVCDLRLVEGVGIGIGVGEVDERDLPTIMAHFHGEKLYTTSVRVVADKIADHASIGIGDVIVAINGDDMRDLDTPTVLTHLRAVSERLKAGMDRSVRLTVLRRAAPSSGGGGGAARGKR